MKNFAEIVALDTKQKKAVILIIAFIIIVSVTIKVVLQSLPPKSIESDKVETIEKRDKKIVY